MKLYPKHLRTILVAITRYRRASTNNVRSRPEYIKHSRNLQTIQCRKYDDVTTTTIIVRHGGMRFRQILLLSMASVVFWMSPSLKAASVVAPPPAATNGSDSDAVAEVARNSSNWTPARIADVLACLARRFYSDRDGGRCRDEDAFWNGLRPDTEIAGTSRSTVELLVNSNRFHSESSISRPFYLVPSIFYLNDVNKSRSIPRTTRTVNFIEIDVCNKLHLVFVIMLLS